jgi:MFS transporter, FHS family, glucose/mannose:H+ symporter
MTQATESVRAVNSRLVFIASAAGLLLFGAGITTLGSVAPWLTSQLKLDDLQTGALFSILPFGILAGSLLFGIISDRYGYKYLLIGCCLFMAAGFLGMACVRNLSWLSIFVFIFGIGGGAMNGASSAAVADSSKDNKGANLSLLSIFFGIGALSMPFILASLNSTLSYQTIIAVFGWLSIAVAAGYLAVTFPPPKIAGTFSFSQFLPLFRRRLIFFVAGFLFCQSSFEGIINNWTTTYLIEEKSVAANAALYALTLYVTGYTITRFFLGTVLKKIPFESLMLASILLVSTGTVLLHLSQNQTSSVVGLIIIGVGLSGGFPLLLGVVAGHYASISGTAFSFVLAIALLGNTIVNYLVGIIATEYGITHLTSVAFVECAVMLLLLWGITKSVSNRNE